MAYYGALVSLVQLLEEINHNHYQYRNFVLGKQQIMKSLHEKFNLLLGSLEDYSSNNDEDEPADCMEIRIRDVSYEARDIIESQISNHIHPNAGNKVIPISKKVMDHKGLHQVKEEVDSIVEELMRIKKTCRTEFFQRQHYPSDVGGSKRSPSGINTMVGFDEHLDTIKAQLCGESSRLQLIPIVGMGGIGKTTLARNIFDDKLIEYRFDVRVWVTVSQYYHIQKVLESIRDSIDVANKGSQELCEGELSEYIYKHLKGRRYLFIMDDIWRTEILDDLRRIFPDDHNGSRIMLTTRLSDVADYAGTFGYLHHIQLLNEGHSWNLLREKVFAQEHCPNELEDIGKFIAKTCQGLPLAIVVVAGVLSNLSKTRYDWEQIANNVGSVVTKNDEHFSKILSLSYNHLPHHLKPCFLYIGCFPEDQEISVPRLIKLWIGEGFLKENGSKRLEEVGEQYLEDLVKRNLVLVNKIRYNGKCKSCSIHDLLRDLCTQKVRHENFFHFSDEKGNIPQGGKNIRRVCLNHWDVSGSPRVITEADFSSHVHSILGSGYYSAFGLLSIKHLRVLDILMIRLDSFPHQIGELFHLRYLALLIYRFFLDRIEALSISKLQNLQTFIVVTYEVDDISLPSEIWKLSQLRHLMIQGMTLFPIPPSGDMVGEVHILENLQTLETVENFTFTEKAIEMIPNLKKLKARYTHCESQQGIWEQYCLNNLVHLCHLETLHIKCMFSTNDPFWVGKPFPESFAFPMNLKELSLIACKLPWEDMTILGSLPNLEVLKLRYNAMKGEVWEPIEGEFLRLKFLLMDMLFLTYWRAECIHFPILEHLKIKECWTLKEIPLEIGDIPTLQLIEVHDSGWAGESAMLIKEEQESLGNDVLQVRVFCKKW